ncbi:MAG: cob(I)yrinic acid a,c-diamide adenosyltransferase [Bacteroidetes bacterium]|nr:cob(I)yrinic acid a,c-diamide adenosyltransferase [Bacteroidota bacterium]
MAFKIYTKTGDLGQTGLIGGTRVPKNHLRIESYGTVDELNSFIGLLADQLPDEHSKTMLREIQDRLFTIGSVLASDPQKNLKMKIPVLREEDIAGIEKEIDSMEEKLEPMKFFILPGGHPTVSTAHIARCVCRRAERSCVALHEEEPVELLVLKYLNRLSDYLFVLARYTGKQLGAEEIPWRPRT